MNILYNEMMTSIYWQVEKRPQSMSQVLQDCLQAAVIKTGVKPTSDKGIAMVTNFV